MLTSTLVCTDSHTSFHASFSLYFLMCQVKVCFIKFRQFNIFINKFLFFFRYDCTAKMLYVCILLARSNFSFVEFLFQVTKCNSCSFQLISFSEKFLLLIVINIIKLAISYDWKLKACMYVPLELSTVKNS